MRRGGATPSTSSTPGRADEARPLLLGALGDADADVRAHAAASIGRHHVVEAVPRLVGALGDPDAHLRAAAAEALGVAAAAGRARTSRRKEAVRAVETLERALGDGEHEVREAAVVALGKLPPTLGKRTAVALTGRLDDEAAGVRQRAAEVLGRMGEARAVVPLLVAARRSDARGAHRGARGAGGARRRARGAGGGAPVARSGRRGARGGGGARSAGCRRKRRWRRSSRCCSAGRPMRCARARRSRSGQIGPRGRHDARRRGAGGGARSRRAAGWRPRRRWCAWARARCRRCAAHLRRRAAGARGGLRRSACASSADAEATPALLDELGARRGCPRSRGRRARRHAARRRHERPMVTLVALLGAPSGSVRRHAAEALRGAVDARATSALAAATGDERARRARHRHRRARAARRQGGAAASSSARSARRDEATAAAAARALGQLGDRRAVDAAGGGARPHASGACGARRPTRWPASPTAAPPPTLLRAVRTAAPDRRADGDRRARRRRAPAARRRPRASCCSATPRAATPPRRWRRSTRSARMGDRAAVPRLARSSSRASTTTCARRALAALGDIGGDEAARTLVTMLAGDYGDPRVRAEAAWALGKQRHAADAVVGRARPARCAPRRRRCAPTRPPRSLGSAARPTSSCGCVDDRDPAVRGNAALALGTHAQGARRRCSGSPTATTIATCAPPPRRRARRRAAPSPAADWIALDVVDFDGAPLGDAGYRLVLPDGLQQGRRRPMSAASSARSRSRPAPARCVLDEAAPSR